MQNFTDIPSSRTLSDSLIEILNNDKTAISCNSGTTFPTTNQQVGMLCYRSDQLKLYQLISTNPDSWRLIMDLASGIDTQFAAKLNAATYTAADVLAKLLTVDGAGTGLDADLLDGQQASAFASSTHNHNATYLGITAKAVDADKLDGYDSTAFVRSVNGAGPDASGNSTVNIDLSSRVAKTGVTMTGNLTIQNTAPTITMQDTDNVTRSLHVNGNMMGFLKSDGNWDMYANNAGQVWTANYGWLHDKFALRTTVLGAQGAARDTGIRTNCGNVNCNHVQTLGTEVFDSGDGRHQLRTYYQISYSVNCDCNCNCGTCCFPLDTMLTMANGARKRVDKMVAGDQVRTAFGDVATVLEPIVCPVEPGEVTVLINQTLRMTREHLLRSPDGWLAVDRDYYAQWLAQKRLEMPDIGIDPNLLRNVEVGDALITENGSICVESIERLTGEAAEVLMSVELDGDQTFFANGIAVESKTNKE